MKLSRPKLSAKSHKIVNRALKAVEESGKRMEGHTNEQRARLEREARDIASTGFMADKRFEYHTHSGTIFRCDSIRLNSEVRVIGYPDSPARFAVDVAEMTAYHATEIWPRLNGFAGYDTLRFRLV